MVSTLNTNTAVRNALDEMVPLLHYMRRDNLCEIFNRVDEIRKDLTEQEELTVISHLIQMGEL